MKYGVYDPSLTMQISVLDYKGQMPNDNEPIGHIEVPVLRFCKTGEDRIERKFRLEERLKEESSSLSRSSSPSTSIRQLLQLLRKSSCGRKLDHQKRKC